MAAAIPAAAAAILEALEIQEGFTLFIWNVLYQVLNAGLMPELMALQEKAYSINRSVALSAPEVAAAVVRSHITEEAGAEEAGLSGINAERFKLMVAQLTNPPGPGDLLQLWRRGVIPEKGTGAASVSVEQGLREGNIGNKWIEAVKVLKTSLPSPESALRAYLEGQADEETARKLWEEWGGEPKYFDLLYNTEGSAPTPLEAADMARRGIIPWTGRGPGVVSFEQAFFEGPWRNKWLKPYQDVSVYLPPPRTVTALLRAGSISAEQAATWLKQQGLDDVAVKAYVDDASNQKTAATKDLAKADIVGMFAAKEITEQQAHDALSALGYDDQAIQFELSYADFKLVEAQVNSLISRLRTLYTGHKIDKQQAVTALANVGMADPTINALLQVWDQQAAASPVLLTAVQIADAAAQGMIAPLDAWNELQGRGYDARDAAIVLALHKVDISTIAAAAGVS